VIKELSHPGWWETFINYDLVQVCYIVSICNRLKFMY